MVERPILFSTEMVRALLVDTKTVTRRLVVWKKRSPATRSKLADGVHHQQRGASGLRWLLVERGLVTHAATNRFGHTGDRLWVRETWAAEPGALLRIGRNKPAPHVLFRADLPPGADEALSPGGPRDPSHGVDFGGRWQPSLHLPRALCRLVLEVVSVRIERLHNITEDDARAEGLDAPASPDSPLWIPGRPWASAYAELWERINGTGSWSLNPHVWRVAFRQPSRQGASDG